MKSKYFSNINYQIFMIILDIFVVFIKVLSNLSQHFGNNLALKYTSALL